MNLQKQFCTLGLADAASAAWQQKKRKHKLIIALESVDVWDKL